MVQSLVLASAVASAQAETENNAIKSVAGRSGTVFQVCTAGESACSTAPSPTTWQHAAPGTAQRAEWDKAAAALGPRASEAEIATAIQDYFRSGVSYADAATKLQADRQGSVDGAAVLAASRDNYDGLNGAGAYDAVIAKADAEREATDALVATRQAGFTRDILSVPLFSMGVASGGALAAEGVTAVAGGNLLRRGFSLVTGSEILTGSGNGLVTGDPTGAIGSAVNAGTGTNAGSYLSFGLQAAPLAEAVGVYSLSRLASGTATVPIAQRLGLADTALPEADFGSGLVNSGGILAAERTGVDLSLTYKPGWSAAQRAEADLKVRILTEGDTVVSSASRSGRSAASRYRRAGNDIPVENDVDHAIDLQLGGSDTVSNMWPLNSSVNRSLGSQIQQSIKNLP